MKAHWMAMTLLLAISMTMSSSAIAQTLHFSIDEQTTQEDKMMAEKAVHQLFNACNDLGIHAHDFTSAHVEVVTAAEMDYHREERGWGKRVVVSFQVRDEPKRIPARYDAHGHTITYHLGGNERPGILTQKAQGAHICGSMIAHDDRDSFLNWRPLAGIIINPKPIDKAPISLIFNGLSEQQSIKAESAWHDLNRYCWGLAVHEEEIASVTFDTDIGADIASIVASHFMKEPFVLHVLMRPHAKTPMEWQLQGQSVRFAVAENGFLVLDDQAGYFCGGRPGQRFTRF